MEKASSKPHASRPVCKSVACAGSPQRAAHRVRCDAPNAGVDCVDFWKVSSFQLCREFTSRTLTGCFCINCLVRDFPKEKDAWGEVDKLGLPVRINDAPEDGRIRFDTLAEHYLQSDFGEDAVRLKSGNTKTITEHVVRDYLSKRWGKDIADEIKPLELQRWLKALHDDKELAWTAISKMRGVMHHVVRSTCKPSLSCVAFTGVFALASMQLSRRGYTTFIEVMPHWVG
jgi:hypothetical protein